MKTVLILAGDDSSATLLSDTVTAAGFVAVRPPADESPERVVARVHADVILAEAEMRLPPDLMRRLEHRGAVLILLSASLSQYELASRARDRGVTHFNQASGPAALARSIADATALARLAAPRRSAVAAAAESVQRARDLTARAGDVLSAANELRIANRIALAACRMNRRLLQETVFACTLDLREKGMALDLVLELVTSVVGGSALDHPASRAEVEAEAAAAAQWAIEAWRAA